MMSLPRPVGLWPRRTLLCTTLVMALSAPAWADGAAPLATVTVQPTALAIGYGIDGVVQPVHQTTVAAQVGGRVTTLHVKAGDAVRAGQLLVSIDDRETQTGVQGSKARVAQADADLAQSRLNFERSQHLQAKGFLSKAALDAAEAQYKAAQAGHDQAKAGAGQSQLSQGYTRVTAPYDGWVQATLVDPGDLAMPGKPLVSVYAPRPLRAVVQVPASRSQEVKAANHVEVEMPGGVWVTPAKVQSLPMADAVSQTVEWRLELPAQVNPTPGQQVRVRFAAGQVQRTVVPATAVLHRGEMTVVYVQQDKGFVLRAVRLGTDHGGAGIEVLAGLKAGDKVAVDAVRAGLGPVAAK